MQLIQSCFALTKTHRVLELGCGDGDLALALAGFAGCIEAIDRSTEAIRAAQERDGDANVRWIEMPVETYRFPSKRYDLIIAFESMHLFAEPLILRKISRALKVGGYFAIGWVVYHWESILYESFRLVFEQFGIAWGDKVTISSFDMTSICAADPAFGEAAVQTLQVPASTTYRTIAEFLASTSKAAPLPLESRRRLAARLEAMFSGLLTTGNIDGVDTYHLGFVRRINDGESC